MDYIETIKRAIRITFQHKSLWVLGFLASLAGGSGGGSGGSGNLPSGSGGSGSSGIPGGSPSFPSGTMPFEEFTRMLSENAPVLIAVVIGVCCFIFARCGQKASPHV